jgi:hypothetical protein
MFLASLTIQYLAFSSLVLLTLLTLMGLGRLIRDWIGLKNRSYLSTLDIWIGLVLLIHITQIVNFFSPVDWKTSIFIIASGLISLYLRRDSLEQTVRNIKDNCLQRPAITLVAGVLIVLWLGLHLSIPGHSDSGLYHFQSVRWINEYPIPPGLGNLHTRLAYNQSWFNLVAILNFYPYLNVGHELSGMMLVLLPTLTILELRLDQLNKGICLTVLIILCLDKELWRYTSSTPDMAVFSFQVVVFLLLIQLLYVNQDLEQNKEALCDLLLICCALTTIKLSATVFALSAILVALYSCRKFIQKCKQVLLKAAALCSFIFSVHIVKGYILSGYPFFPSSFAGLPKLDWMIPLEVVNMESKIIMNWARQPGISYTQVPVGWGWVNSWFTLNFKEKRLIFFLTLGLILFSIGFKMFGRTATPKKSMPWIGDYLPLYFVFTASIVFWFLTAPDWRFLGAIPWLIPILTAWIIMRQIQAFNSINVFWCRKVFGVVLASLVFAISAHHIKQTMRNRGGIPSAATEPLVLPSGLRVNVSRLGMCWDSPLPCTSEVIDDRLRSRDIDQVNPNLGMGFSVRGEN